MKHDMNRISLIAAAALAALALHGSLFAKDRVPPKTVVVSSAAETGGTSLAALVEAVRQTTLSAQVPGAIVEVMVRAGQRVQAGQPLVRIDARAAQPDPLGAAAHAGWSCTFAGFP